MPFLPLEWRIYSLCVCDWVLTSCIRESVVLGGPWCIPDSVYGLSAAIVARFEQGCGEGVFSLFSGQLVIHDRRKEQNHLLSRGATWPFTNPLA